MVPPLTQMIIQEMLVLEIMSLRALHIHCPLILPPPYIWFLLVFSISAALTPVPASTYPVWPIESLLSHLPTFDLHTASLWSPKNATPMLPCFLLKNAQCPPVRRKLKHLILFPKVHPVLKGPMVLSLGCTLESPGELFKNSFVQSPLQTSCYDLCCGTWVLVLFQTSPVILRRRMR